MQFSLILTVLRVWVCYLGQTEREKTVSATTYLAKKVEGYGHWDKIWVVSLSENQSRARKFHLPKSSQQKFLCLTGFSQCVRDGKLSTLSSAAMCFLFLYLCCCEKVCQGRRIERKMEGLIIFSLYRGVSSIYHKSYALDLFIIFVLF